MNKPNVSTPENKNLYAGVMVRGPGNKTVLVYDKSKDRPAWKFPGGGGKWLAIASRWETPEETASRELEEETGLIASSLTLLAVINKGTHMWYLYESVFDDFNRLRPRGDDGEFVKVFPASQLLSMQNFLRQHRQVTENLVLEGKIQLLHSA